MWWVVYDVWIGSRQELHSTGCAAAHPALHHLQTNTLPAMWSMGPCVWMVEMAWFFGVLWLFGWVHLGGPLSAVLTQCNYLGVWA